MAPVLLKTPAVTPKVAKASEPARLALAGAAAALLLASPAANAGVVFENKPNVKSFVAEAPAKKAEGSTSKAAPALKAEKKAEKKAERKEEYSEDSFDPRGIALPASIVVLGAMGFAASKVDGEFDTFISDAMYKKSDVLGAGYENFLKAEGGVAPRKGTQPKNTKGSVKGNKKGLF